MARWIGVLGCCALLALVGRADELSRVIQVIRPDGKPAPQAKVWVYRLEGPDFVDGAEPKPLVTDVRGEVIIPFDKQPREEIRAVFVKDGEGRMGWTSLVLKLANPQGVVIVDQGDPCIVELVPLEERTGILRDAEGKPIAGAQVTPLGFYDPDLLHPEPSTGFDPDILEKPMSTFFGGHLPRWEQNKLSVKTDASGRFQLKAPAERYYLHYQIQVDGLARSRWAAQPKASLDTRLLKTGSVTITATGENPGLVKGARFQLHPLPGKNRQENGQVQPLFHAKGTLDANGKAVIPQVVPGDYRCHFSQDGTLPAVFKETPPLKVLPGEASSLQVAYEKGALATGRIIDRVTGKGISGVTVDGTVNFNGKDSASTFSVETDSDGKFAAYGPAGVFLSYLSILPDGYTLPQEFKRVAKAEAGKPGQFPTLALEKAVTLQGVVQLDGRPVSHADITLAMQRLLSGCFFTDKEGRFCLKNLDPTQKITPRVRAGSAANLPKTYDLSKVTGPITLEISDAQALNLGGMVTDKSGKPVPKAWVKLIHKAEDKESGAPGPVELNRYPTRTDTNGRFQFQGFWARDSYTLEVIAAGFEKFTLESDKGLTGEPGQKVEFPPVRLEKCK